MERRHGGIQDKTDHDQVGVESRMVHVEQVEVQGTGRLIAQDKTGQQDQAAGSVHQNVPVAGGHGFFPFAEPDQDDGGKGHQFPEDKQRYKVSTVYDPQRAADIQPGRHVLLGVLDMQAVHGADDAHERHDIAEHLAQGINPAEGQLPIHETDNAIGAVLHHQDRGKGKNGNHDEIWLPGRPHDKRQQQSTDNQNKGRMYKLSHNNPLGS